MVPIDRPKNSTQHMSASKFFSRVLKPQPKKYRYGNFFNMSRCDISVKQNFLKISFHWLYLRIWRSWSHDLSGNRARSDGNLELNRSAMLPLNLIVIIKSINKWNCQCSLFTQHKYVCKNINYLLTLFRIMITCPPTSPSDVVFLEINPLK